MTEPLDVPLEEGLWDKVWRSMGRLPLLPDALAAYYCMRDRATPSWAKTSIGSALTYFVLPWDAIPDLVGPPGYTDDAAVLAALIGTLGALIKAEHYQRANALLARVAAPRSLIAPQSPADARPIEGVRPA
jgi:uncharacterized membrane protein YkvA (DUF1232 family)